MAETRGGEPRGESDWSLSEDTTDMTVTRYFRGWKHLCCIFSMLACVQEPERFRTIFPWQHWVG